MLSEPRAWSLDGQPLLGISVFAVLGLALEELLARRFGSFRTIYLPTAGQLRECGFELLATGRRRTTRSGCAAATISSLKSCWRR
jgi:hypothetical protein